MSYAAMCADHVKKEYAKWVKKHKGERTFKKEHAKWLKQHDIKPATGERAALLDELLAHVNASSKHSKGLFSRKEMREIIAAERSGFRDGDGCWYGSEPVSGIPSDIGAGDWGQRWGQRWEQRWKKSCK